MITGGENSATNTELALLFGLPDLELTSPETNVIRRQDGLPELALTGFSDNPEMESEKHAQPGTAYDDEKLAETLFQLAGEQVRCGDHKNAQRLLSHALVIVEDRLGSEHLAVAQILANLGTVHFLQGNYEYAERFLHKAILVYDTHKGCEVETARTFNNLSAVYNKLGEYADGEACLAEALAIMEGALKEELGVTDHPELIPILQNYVELMVKTNRSQTAAAMKGRIEDINKFYSVTQAA
jgi:tetratricopeptide (TPR) repeat protein